MPEFLIGDNAVVKMGDADAPNTAVDISDYVKSLKFGEDVGNEDITTLGPTDGAKALAYLLNHMTFDMGVLFDKPAGTFWRRNGRIIRGRHKVALELYLAGEVSGAEKITCTVLVLNRNRQTGLEVDKGDIRLERSGTVVETVVD